MSVPRRVEKVRRLAGSCPGAWRATVRVAFAAALLLAVARAATARDAAEPGRPLSAQDREALGRVAYAEAGNQREEGLAAVIHAVLNRVSAGRFGTGVQGVLDAPGQFEPVARAGGSWRNLPPLTPGQRLVFGTILDLILQGRLPDLTAGSTYFQNAAIVAQRAASGQVARRRVNFGGQTPAAVVRDHSFFRGADPAAASKALGPLVAAATPADPGPQARFIRIGAAAKGGARVRILRGTPSKRDPAL